MTRMTHERDSELPINDSFWERLVMVMVPSVSNNRH